MGAANRRSISRIRGSAQRRDAQPVTKFAADLSHEITLAEYATWSTDAPPDWANETHGVAERLVYGGDDVGKWERNTQESWPYPSFGKSEYDGSSPAGFR